jgi:uncharacterized protein
MAENSIEVKVAFAMPGRQRMLTLELKQGATINDAINATKLLDEFPEIKRDQLQTGIWGKAFERSTKLQDGDRVELTRPLIIEPQEARRVRAAAATPVKTSRRTSTSTSTKASTRAAA